MLQQKYEGNGCGHELGKNKCSYHKACEYMIGFTYGIVYNEIHYRSTNAFSDLGTGGNFFTNHSLGRNWASFFVFCSFFFGKMRMMSFHVEIILKYW